MLHVACGMRENYQYLLLQKRNSSVTHFSSKRKYIYAKQLCSGRCPFLPTLFCAKLPFFNSIISRRRSILSATCKHPIKHQTATIVESKNFSFILFFLLYSAFVNNTLHMQSPQAAIIDKLSELRSYFGQRIAEQKGKTLAIGGCVDF